MHDALKERALMYTRRHPQLFFGLYSVRPKYRDLLVDSGTELVIEGFPRSGNTFGVFAFRYAQPREIHVAHHMHAPAQMMRAARRKIPALLLMRDPVDAVLSLMLRDPRFTAEMALRYYVSFYDAVSAFRDHYVLGTFEEVTGDYGAVVDRINDKFGTGFTPFDHTQENVDRVFEQIEESHRAKRRNEVIEEQIARPSATKASLKADLRGNLQAPELGPLTVRATSLYDALRAPIL